MSMNTALKIAIYTGKINSFNHSHLLHYQTKSIEAA